MLIIDKVMKSGLFSNDNSHLRYHRYRLAWIEINFVKRGKDFAIFRLLACSQSVFNIAQSEMFADFISLRNFLPQGSPLSYKLLLQSSKSMVEISI